MILRLALLGDPVEQSRSPAMHTAAMAALGINGIYRAIRADRRRLAAALKDLTTGRLDGANVTMPLKTEAARLCDRLTDEAAQSGSANTLRGEGGKVVGHSTDVVAAREILNDGRFPDDAPLLVLGGGGAAAAILAGNRGREALVSARSQRQSLQLAAHHRARAVAFGEPVEGAIVVNATPLGMAGEHLPAAVMEKASGLVDLPYGAETTPAVVSAASRGLPFADGLEFLIAQAVAAFEWWTGIHPPREVMERAARSG